MYASLFNSRVIVEVPQIGLPVGDGIPRSSRSRRDLPDRPSLLHVGVEDQAHDLGLGLEDLDPAGPPSAGTTRRWPYEVFQNGISP